MEGYCRGFSIAWSRGAKTVIEFGFLNPTSCKSRNEAMTLYPFDLRTALDPSNQEAPGNPIVVVTFADDDDVEDPHTGSGTGLRIGMGS